jgi:hypothetical protein
VFSKRIEDEIRFPIEITPRPSYYSLVFKIRPNSRHP